VKRGTGTEMARKKTKNLYVKVWEQESRQMRIRHKGKVDQDEKSDCDWNLSM